MKAALGDTQGTSGIERFGETIEPIVDLWGQPEWALLRRENLFGDVHTAGAVVAEFTWVAVVNPAGTRHLVILERARVGAGAGMTANMASMLAADVAATTALVKRVALSDLRTAVSSGSAVLRGVAELWAGSDPVNTGNANDIAVIQTTSNDAAFQNLPLVIPPGFAVVFQGNTVNTSLRVSVSGRERTVLPGEPLRL